jgi:hypothetical protein
MLAFYCYLHYGSENGTFLKIETNQMNQLWIIFIIPQLGMLQFVWLTYQSVIDGI